MPHRDTLAHTVVAPKPAHLGPQFAQQFEDREVARAYHTRPTYLSEASHILSGLLPERDRVVLSSAVGRAS